MESVADSTITGPSFTMPMHGPSAYDAADLTASGWATASTGERAASAPWRAASGRTPLLNRGWARCALDASMAALGFALGYAARYAWHIGGIHEIVYPIPLALALLLGAVAVALTVLDLARGGTYRRLAGGPMDGALTAGRAVTAAMAVVIVLGAVSQQTSVSRLAYIYAWALMIACVLAGRVARGSWLARGYRDGRGVRNVVVLGATPAGKMVMQNLATSLGRGYRLLGFVDEHGEAPHRFGRFAKLGSVAELPRLLSAHMVDEIVIALPAASHARIAEILTHCGHRGVAVKLVPDLFDLRLSRVRLDSVVGIPIIDVGADTVGRARAALKRALDLTVAACALIVAAPLLAVTALAIRLDSLGPILFRQERLGKDGRPFAILKFRSMRTDAERQLTLLREQNEASGPLFKMRHDPRVTRVGRVIRKLSIDELPQLWNVLRGDMSLVGPRPPLAREVAEYEDWHVRRLEVTPGITCLWGVSGRSKLDFDEMVMLDLYYIDNWSLGLDLRILLRTALTLLRPGGAY
jgi:exopolysaccharide biosynthesis polyprenyl glycosylphosphotransferase